MLRDVPIRYEEKEFDGTFHDPNVFRQKAGPEGDAAWEKLGVNCMTDYHQT